MSLTCAYVSEHDGSQSGLSLKVAFSATLRDQPDSRCGKPAPVGTSWAVVATKEPRRFCGERGMAPSEREIREMWVSRPVVRPAAGRPAPAQAKTTVRCPLSSTRCSVCQRTACARTRRSTSCPLACSMDTESSCPARVTSCSMIGPSSRSAVT